MLDLRNLLSNNGFSNVKTYIQSGNSFAQSTGTTPGKIGSLIQSEFGFTPETLILDREEFLDAVINNPFNSGTGKTIHFYFCVDQPPRHGETIRLKADSEEYELQGKVFYLHAPDGIGPSKLVSNIESCLNTKATARNLNTIKKLQELAGDT